MGLFDDVICELPMPDGFVPPGGMFQCKDLGATMDRYTITKEGRLVAHGRHLNPGAILRAPDDDITNGQVIEYHGDVRIYKCDNTNKLREYRVRFTEGVVTWIKPIPEQEQP